MQRCAFFMGMSFAVSSVKKLRCAVICECAVSCVITVSFSASFLLFSFFLSLFFLFLQGKTQICPCRKEDIDGANMILVITAKCHQVQRASPVFSVRTATSTEGQCCVYKSRRKQGRLSASRPASGWEGRSVCDRNKVHQNNNKW